MSTAPLQNKGAGIAVVRGTQVLLIRRHDNGLWDIPGGAVEVGESVGDAARRELKEETGLEAPDVTLLDVFSGSAHRHTYPDGNVVDWVTAVYLARDFTGTLTPGDDAAEARWWPLAGLPTDVSSATAAYFAALRARPGATP
ncbi:NUDIX domain-containing protein [Deinococcus marmoris]|uniref:NUDIX domain-containing protein n=1 Tax=Deinococcus marmoris TaxID=249408 RepID=UPI001FDEF4A6|nr:NUDIX domain-containing protein [Deinococcus marmoris]